MEQTDSRSCQGGFLVGLICGHGKELRILTAEKFSKSCLSLQPADLGIHLE